MQKAGNFFKNAKLIFSEIKRKLVSIETSSNITSHSIKVKIIK